MKIVKVIGASIGVIVCFFYLGCGSVQIAEAAHNNVSPLTIATKILPSAISGTPYVAILDASGGMPGYTWNVTAGSLPSGLTLATSTGVISGKPTAVGNFSFSVTLSDAEKPTQTKSTAMTVSVAAPRLAIVASALPSAAYGGAYSQTLQATGGVPSYKWSVTSGSLPAGLTLSSAGVISGVPTASGGSRFTATVQDSENPYQTASLGMTIVVPATRLQIIPATLPAVVVGTSYSQTLQASGGTPSYKWSIASGNLPAGLSLSTNGTISGVPSAIGTSIFTASVSDSGSPIQTASASVSIAVAPTKLTVSSSTLPSVTIGTAYSQALKAVGGTAPYTWAITSGAVPTGLTLSPSGVISGMPTQTGTSQFTATVTDSSIPVQTVSAATSLVVAPTKLSITSSALPSVTVGTTYSQSLNASGGTAPYAWSITSGALPVGLTLAPSTGAITGVPTQSGTAKFTATVSDSSSPTQTTSATASLVVAPTPLAIVPSTLPPTIVGAPYSQTLKVTGGTAAYTWSITSGKLPSGLTLAASTGAISGVPTTSGVASFTATVVDSSSPAQAASSTAAVAVSPILLTITSSAMPSGTVGTSYSQALQATGGAPPYIWTLTSGSLPAGMILSTSTGTILGTPTSIGTSTFTATVTDSSNPAQITSATTAVVVKPASLTTSSLTALAITTSTLPSVNVGTAYSQALQATGGTAPYTWSITSGQLPTGLSISAGGVVSGTPTVSGTASFTATVNDSGTPAQTKSATLAITTGAAPLSITSSTLASGTTGTSYSQVLQASGGTPGYTWSITSGSLPAGLTLAATTGVISGTPTVGGTSSIVATVADSSNPAQTRSAATSVTVSAATQTSSGPGTTWYIRPDGGTRYSSNVTTGQCNGKSDAPYPGSGVNQNCAFNDFRYLWDDNSGMVGQGVWVIAGGDTVIVRGCTALPGQQNASNPNCRIGWDMSSGYSPNNWCYGVGSYNCYNPPIPAGTAAQHTRILGQNYAACNTGGATNPKLYQSNLTQIFGGFSLTYTLNLTNTSYVDIQCIEITSHNGACVTIGAPQYPRGCSKAQPVDDFAGGGILTNNATSNIGFQDVYIHGFTSTGLFGPIGGPIAMTRMFVGFNAFAGWNFDDGSDTPDAIGSSITANHVIMEGNGCEEQYPITNAFPALVCYDTNSAGFGDSWSGQDTTLASFTCNDCENLYNTKDGFIGPHTATTVLSITNSLSIGNMGQNWKWGGLGSTATTVTFENNLTVGNCVRMSQPLPGAPANYNQYLTGFCRAAGNDYAIVIPPGSNWTIANNTDVTYQPTIFDIACPYGVSPCTSTVNIFNNIYLGYLNAHNPYGSATSALYYIESPSIKVVSSHNIEYGLRNNDCPIGGTGNICADPLFVNEPAQGIIPSESTLDNFNFNLTSGSPAIGAGTTYSALPSTDYYGTPTANPPVIGAIQP